MVAKSIKNAALSHQTLRLNFIYANKRRGTLFSLPQ